MKALALYINLKNGIRLQFEAAGLYCESLLAIINDRPIDKEHVKKLITEPVISGLNMFEMFYTDSDFEYLEKNEKLKHLAQQILFSTYTALEIYYIEKFKEYLKTKLEDLEPSIKKTIINKISFRSIEEIKDNYLKYLGIHLPSFGISRIYTQPKCSFQPSSSWDAILTIANARNEIAHTGISKSYKITTLLDCWYPYEFVNDYVTLFNTNFDSFLLENKKGKLIIEYERRKAESLNH